MLFVDAMRYPAAVTLTALLFSAGGLAQQPGAATPVGTPTTAKAEGLLEIYQIDLDPSGTAFALGKPVLEGDAYVLTAWPDKAVVHLAKSKVKKITLRTKSLDEYVVYQIDLAPTGRMIARENPTLKGTTYTFHTWRDGKLMSLRQADVKAVTKVTGVPAFKIQQEERGASLNGNLPMQGGGNVTVIGTPADAAPAAPAPTPAAGNWSYQGQPGVSDAYGPPSAAVASPGDVPKAAPAADATASLIRRRRARGGHLQPTRRRVGL